MNQSNSKKWIVPSIITAVVVAIIVSSVYYFKQKQANINPTANTSTSTSTSSTQDWKTYTNTQYGFEFKYPATCSITTNLEQEIFSIKFGGFYGESCCGGNLNIAPNVKKVSLKEYLGNKYKFNDLKLEEIAANYGITALKLASKQSNAYYEKFPTGSGLEYNYWTIGTPEWIFGLSHDQACGTPAEKILSTFKFINADPSATVTSPNGEEQQLSVPGLPSTGFPPAGK